MRYASFTVLAGWLLAAAATAQSPGPLSPGSRQVADADLLLGVWNIVGLEAGGRPEPEKNYKGNTLLFIRDRIPGRVRLPAILGYQGTVQFTIKRERAFLREGTFPPVEFNVALDATKSPRTIDLTAKGNTLRGIYKLEGDDLIICLSIGGQRPTEFATRPDLPVETFTLRRGWERHVEKGVFSVELPGRPELRTRKLTLTTPPLPISLAVFPSPSDDVTFVVASLPPDVPPLQFQWQQVSDRVRELLLTEFATNAKVIKEVSEEFTSTGSAGRELVIVITEPGSDTPTSIRVRVFRASDRYFLLGVVGTSEGVQSRDTDRFFNSFRLLPDKKDRSVK